jgi:hypothetical protein
MKMRQISFIAFASCGAMVSLIFLPASADTPSGQTALTGNMAAMQFLVGSWDCTVKVAAMQGQPATTDHGVVAYTVVPGNAIHSHVAASDYASDNYSGYVDSSKSYWMSTIDAFGDVSSETSTDGKVFSGSSTGGGRTSQIRDTLSHPMSNTIRDVQEVQSNGTWQTATDASCTRT